MSMTYRGPDETALALVKSIKGWLALRIVNRSWATVEGSNYLVTYRIDERAVDGAESVGAADGAKQGYLTKFRPDFEQSFASGRSLRIYLGNRLAAALELTDTAAAIGAVNQCLEGLRGNLAVQPGSVRSASNPPVPIGGAGMALARPPTPIRSATTWIMASDYPSRALREEREGTTAYVLSVAPDGKVMDCQITTSSGHADIDAATCDSVRKRARFNPAKDASGKPTLGRYANRVRWVIPRQ
jgi:TonB family protein